MKRSRTFKAGESLDSLAQFARATADELTGESGEPTLPANLKVTIETTQARELAIDPVLVELELMAAKPDVEAYLGYRSDELRKPLRSVPGLRRLLNPFKANPSGLSESITNTMRQGWTGLFGADKPTRSRADQSGGQSGEF